MNIAAVMTVLDEWELDHSAKHAVLIVACRADRAGVAKLPVGRIAADMKVHYNTARRALDRAVEAEYLTVDKPAGFMPVWRLTPRVTRDPTSRVDEGDPARHARPRRASGARTKDSLEKSKEGGAASLSLLRAAPPGENPPAVCPACADHSGWLWHPSGVVRCTHG